MTKKVRAVRLPLEERVLESMGKDLEKNGLVSQQSHQITISAVENWIKYNVEPAFQDKFKIRLGEGDKRYLDIIISEDNGYCVPNCRSLHRAEICQVQWLIRGIRPDWIVRMRVVEYMFDPSTGNATSCYSATVHENAFYQDQQIINCAISDPLLADMVESDAQRSLFESLNVPDSILQKKMLEVCAIDRFVFDKQNKSVYWTYYNPNSASGGQVIRNTITIEQIDEIVCDDWQEFFDHLGCKATQELIDRGTDAFIEALFEILTTSCNLYGLSEYTMQSLRCFALMAKHP